MRVPRRVAVRLATLAAVMVTVVVVHTWRESDWPIDDRVRLGECFHCQVLVSLTGMHMRPFERCHVLGPLPTPRALRCGYE